MPNKPPKELRERGPKETANLNLNSKVRKWGEDMAAARGQSLSGFVEDLIRTEFQKLFGPIKPDGYPEGEAPAVLNQSSKTESPDTLPNVPQNVAGKILASRESAGALANLGPEHQPSHKAASPTDSKPGPSPDVPPEKDHPHTVPGKART